MTDSSTAKRSASAKPRLRWSLPVEIWWTLHVVLGLVLVPTPAIGFAFVVLVIYGPTALSFWRHHRTVARLGYWYSVLVVNVEAVALAALFVTGVDSFVRGILVGCVLLALIALCIASFFASETEVEEINL